MRVLKEISVSYTRKSGRLTKISSSEQAFKVAKKVYKIDQCVMQLNEYFYLLLLNNNNQVLGYYKVSQGGITGTVADIRLIFATALKVAACGIIDIHNHPSGNLKPSQSDIKLTSKIKDAGKLLDIRVLDHLIITNQGYYSFADSGTL